MADHERRVEARNPPGTHRSLLSLAGGNVVQVGTRLLLGAVVPLVLVEFDTTKSSIGLVLTGMWAIYALLQFPSGVLADRYGERPVLLVGLGAVVVGSLLVAVAPTLALFAAFVLLLGAGTGLYFAPATSLVSRLYDEHGGPLSALTAGSAVAGVLYPAVGTAVGVRFGWRVAVAATGLVAVPVLVGIERSLPAMAPANAQRSLRAVVDWSRMRELITRPSVAFVTLMSLLVSFAFQGIASFLTTFFVEYRGLDTGIAGLAFSVVFGVSAVAQVVAGNLSDRYSRDVAIATSVVLAGCGLSVLLVVPGTVGVVVGSVTLGAGISWPGPMQAWVVDNLAGDERGYGYGLVRTTYMVPAASGSVAVGTLADTGGWGRSVGLLVGLLGVCLLLLVLNRVLGFDL